MMGAEMWGADPESLENLARVFRAKGRALQEIVLSVRSALASTEWEGMDGTGFRSDWDSSHRERLESVSTSLLEIGDLLVRQAQEQRGASGVGVTSGEYGLLGGSIARPPAYSVWLDAASEEFVGMVPEYIDAGMLMGDVTGVFGNGTAFGIAHGTWAGLGVGALATLTSAQEHGWGHYETQNAALNTVGGTISSATFGPPGALAWYAASQGAEWLGGEGIPDAWFLDNYGATMDEVHAAMERGEQWAIDANHEFGQASTWKVISGTSPAAYVDLMQGWFSGPDADSYGGGGGGGGSGW